MFENWQKRVSTEKIIVLFLRISILHEIKQNEKYPYANYIILNAQLTKKSGDMWDNIDYMKTTWFSPVSILLLNKWHIEHYYILYNVNMNYMNILLYLYGLGTTLNIIKHNLQ